MSRLSVFEEKIVVLSAITRLQSDLVLAMHNKDDYRISDLTKRIATLNTVNVALDKQILKKYGYTNPNSAVSAAIRPNIHVVKDPSRHLNLVDPDGSGSE